MSRTQEVDALVTKLASGTEAGRFVWGLAEGYYELALPDVIVRVGQRPKEQMPGLWPFLSVVTTDGLPVVTTEDAAGLSRLYDVAAKATQSHILRDTLSYLDQASAVSRPPRTTLPRPPSVEEERLLFGSLAGQWHVDYGRGTETVIITPTGLYSVGPRTGDLKPKFQLRAVAINRPARKIELAKDYLDGRRLQIEVLELDDMDRPRSMSGMAKHDSHPLAYRREG